MKIHGREGSWLTLVKELNEIEIDGPKRVVNIGEMVPLYRLKALIELLRSFKGFFACNFSDMTSITTSVITHELNIDPYPNTSLKGRGPWVMRRS